MIKVKSQSIQKIEWMQMYGGSCITWLANAVGKYWQVAVVMVDPGHVAPTKNCSFVGDWSPVLIHDFLPPIFPARSESSSKTAAQLVQLFLLHSQSWPADRHTHRPHYNCDRRPHLMLCIVMWPKKWSPVQFTLWVFDVVCLCQFVAVGMKNLCVYFSNLLV